MTNLLKIKDYYQLSLIIARYSKPAPLATKDDYGGKEAVFGLRMENINTPLPNGIKTNTSESKRICPKNIRYFYNRGKNLDLKQLIDLSEKPKMASFLLE